MLMCFFSKDISMFEIEIFYKELSFIIFKIIIPNNKLLSLAIDHFFLYN